MTTGDRSCTPSSAAAGPAGGAAGAAAADPVRRWCLIGPPDSRRIAGFVDAIRRFSAAAPRRDEIAVVPYTELLSDRWAESLMPGTILRLESPGGSPATAAMLLEAGIEPMAAAASASTGAGAGAGAVPIDRDAIARLAGQWSEGQGRGEILHPRQWYLGYRSLLQRLQARLATADVRWMSTPESVIAAFDKQECLSRWSGLPVPLPVPRRWEGIGSYQQLREAVRERHARLFLKLRYGYSAMGAMALEWRDGQVRALTTVETVWTEGRPRLFTSKRVRPLRREFEIAWLVDTLALEEIVVEEWLPKARWQGTPFDLRIVTIGGAAAQVVGRRSASPFTNLNLDAARLPAEQVAARLGTNWPVALRLAEAAAAALPDAFTLGIDLLVRPCRSRFALLEANAFGDYLPRLLHAGWTTYEAQVAAFTSRRATHADLLQEVPA